MQQQFGSRVFPETQKSFQPVSSSLHDDLFMISEKYVEHNFSIKFVCSGYTSAVKIYKLKNNEQRNHKKKRQLEGSFQAYHICISTSVKLID